MEKIGPKTYHIKKLLNPNTALRLNLNNIPNDYQVSNMVGVAHNVFESS